MSYGKEKKRTLFYILTSTVTFYCRSDNVPDPSTAAGLSLGTKCVSDVHSQLPPPPRLAPQLPHRFPSREDAGGFYNPRFGPVFPQLYAITQTACPPPPPHCYPPRPHCYPPRPLYPPPHYPPRRTLSKMPSLSPVPDVDVDAK